jgi:hypothetical protein
VIYQRALALEFAAYDLDFSCKVCVDVRYKGKRVGRKRVDFIVGNKDSDLLLPRHASNAASSLRGVDD